MHATGTQSAADLFPKQLGNVVPVQPVQDSASFLGVDQSTIDLARIFDRFLDRFLGDFVKNEPMDGDFWLQNLVQVPTNRFSFAVFVRREIEAVGVFESRF